MMYDAKIRNQREYMDYQNNFDGMKDLVDSLVSELQIDPNSEIKIKDIICSACSEPSNYILDMKYFDLQCHEYQVLQYSDRAIPFFRERLICEKCGLNNRQRYMARKLLDEIKIRNSEGGDALVSLSDQLKNIGFSDVYMLVYNNYEKYHISNQILFDFEAIK